MGEIKLSLSTRTNLLSLQATSDAVARTTGRLASGLKVATSFDDPVAFSAADALLGRAAAFSFGLVDIELGRNALASTLAGLAGIARMVEQLQGLLFSLSGAVTAVESRQVTEKYNLALQQIDAIANDATYQSFNLINNASQVLDIRVGGPDGLQDIQITALNSSTTGLGLTTVATNLFFTFTTALPSVASRASIASVATISSIASLASVAAVTLRQSEPAIASMDSIASAASQPSQAGTATNPDSVPSQASRASVASVASIASRESVAAVQAAPSVGSTASVPSRACVASSDTIAAIPSITIAGVNQVLISSRQALVDNALFKLRADQQRFSTISSVLTIRADFTKSYTQTLQDGAEQLTLIDLNEESANLTALQTRQQLGVVSLSITARSEQSILRLF